MSLYNLINGFSPACILVMPMLGRKQNEWPRFRDCLFDRNGDVREIHIFTRVGSANQNSGYGEEKLYEDPNYLRFEDWEEDTTYGTYIFKCPAKWEKDFDRINDGNLSELSPEYYDMQSKFWEKGEEMVARIKELAARIESRRKEVKEGSAGSKG
jgi:hypothetical protein